MARIIYALSGQGRGHSSRVIAMTEALRRRGHEVVFCCGGTAFEILSTRGETVIEVPALVHGMNGDRVSVLATLRKNAALLFAQRRVISDLAAALIDQHADLLITDFEAFAPRAADSIGLPVVSFNHQQVVTETTYSLPARYAVDRLTASLAINLVAPKHPRHVVISSFFFPPVKYPQRTTLIHPVIRDEVKHVATSWGDHFVVYVTEKCAARRIIEVLAHIDASFLLYNIEPANENHCSHLVFKKTGGPSFLADLASCRGVIATAGFTLMSESLFLGKPLLVLPSPGSFEQTINAFFLRKSGWGDAVIDRPLQTTDVHALMRKSHEPKDTPQMTSCGNEKGVACIEKVLSACSKSRVFPCSTPNERVRNRPSTLIAFDNLS
jgi:uncharacterized protein (TIGR00661 family)